MCGGADNYDNRYLSKTGNMHSQKYLSQQPDNAAISSIALDEQKINHAMAKTSFTKGMRIMNPFK